MPRQDDREAEDLLVGFHRLRAGYETAVTGPVSFCVRAGEVVGLYGPNGCGKTTVIRVLTGEARIFGGIMHRRPGLRIVYQAQQPVDINELPLRAGELYRLLADDADFRKLPRRLRVLAGRRADRLSGGQRQLLMVWSVLRHRADLVLLDEPTNNLDPDGERLLVEELCHRQRSHGVLLVSHDSAFLRRVCHRLVEVSS